MRRATLAIAFALALPAGAAEWPPSGEAAARMRELQQVIARPESTATDRHAAREELGRMLMRDERTLPPAKRAARAAIDPLPSVVKPVNVAPAPPPPPGASVARIEVIEPAKPVVDPRSGSAVAPITPVLPSPAPTHPGFAVDPRTGNTLHPSGNGFVDPRTGAFVPR